MPEWIADILKQAAGVLLAISPLLNSGIRDLVVKKFQLSFDKALENRKAMNDRKNYISKTRFDKEFEIYQALSEKQISLVYGCSELVVYARKKYDIADCTKFLEQFVLDSRDTSICLRRYAPFISQQIYDKYHTLDIKATALFELVYGYFKNKTENGSFTINGKEYTLGSSLKEIEERQKEIASLSDEIIKHVREYLDSLDVLER